MAARWYVVGERGPELFVPRNIRRIVTTSACAAAKHDCAVPDCRCACHLRSA